MMQLNMMMATKAQYWKNVSYQKNDDESINYDWKMMNWSIWKKKKKKRDFTVEMLYIIKIDQQNHNFWRNILGDALAIFLWIHSSTHSSSIF